MSVEPDQVVTIHATRGKGMPDQAAERREQRLANQLALEATPGPWREDDVAIDDD